MSSFASAECSSNSKGGVLELDNSSTFETITSISQVNILGLFCPSGLDLTFQVAFITYSDLNLSAVSHEVLSSSGSNTT